jgi:hypothetical protein
VYVCVLVCVGGWVCVGVRVWVGLCGWVGGWVGRYVCYVYARRIDHLPNEFHAVHSEISSGDGSVAG